MKQLEDRFPRLENEEPEEYWARYQEHITKTRGWPKHVKMVRADTLEHLGVDHRNNRLYWDGVPIVTENTVRLEGWTLFFAAAAAIATVVSALWPIAVHFGRV